MAPTFLTCVVFRQPPAALAPFLLECPDHCILARADCTYIVWEDIMALQTSVAAEASASWTMLEVVLRQLVNPCTLFRLFLYKFYIRVTLTPSLMLSEVLRLLLTFSKRSIQPTNFWKRRSAEPVFMQVISTKSLLKRDYSLTWKPSDS